MKKHRDKSLHKGEEYINSYPCLKKWINQCVQCQARGYNPDMPEAVGHTPIWDKGNGLWPYCTRHIKRWFKPLVLDEKGLCEVCGIHQK